MKLAETVNIYEKLKKSWKKKAANKIAGWALDDRVLWHIKKETHTSNTVTTSVCA